jgi:hypothetical protein
MAGGSIEHTSVGPEASDRECAHHQLVDALKCPQFGYSHTSWKRILNPGFQDGSRLNPKYVSNARDFCAIELIALPFIIPGRLTCT